MRVQTHQIFTGAAAALVLSILHVQAGYVDITVNDGGPKSGSYVVQDGPTAGQWSSDPRSGINESGSVTANCVDNATWDLRAIAFDVNTNKLTIVSGFNPLALNEGIGIGDIFIDTNNSYFVPSRPSGVGDGYFTYANSTAGYEYAIHLIDPATGNLNYNIAALSGASVLQSTGYAQNAFSDPAKLIPSGSDTSVSSGQFSVITLSDADVLANLGVNVGTNGCLLYTSPSPRD